MNTTLNRLRAHSPCATGRAKMLAHLGKTTPDDEPLPILTILEVNGLEDALWALRAVEGHDSEIRQFAVWCARQVQHLMTDKRSLDALDTAEKFAGGRATLQELDAAGAAARAAAQEATPVGAAAPAWAAARAAARDAGGNVSQIAACAASRIGGAAQDAQEAQLREILT